jgi:Ran GTPase-activating protein (RanGAP) involved in mRNA processing and transport
MNYLKGDNALRSLDISSNKIQKEGADYIAQGLHNHRKLLNLNLSDNNLTSDGFLQFTEIVRNNHSLEVLNVSKNMLVGYGILTFFHHALPYNINLKEINFSTNLIEVKCAELIKQCISVNFSILKVDLSGNSSIPLKFLTSIEKECELNRVIREEILSKLKRVGHIDSDQDSD